MEMFSFHQSNLLHYLSWVKELWRIWCVMPFIVCRCRGCALQIISWGI